MAKTKASLAERLGRLKEEAPSAQGLKCFGYSNLVGEVPEAYESFLEEEGLNVRNSTPFVGLKVIKTGTGVELDPTRLEIRKGGKCATSLSLTEAFEASELIIKLLEVLV